MRQFIDYEWKKETKYRLFTYQQLIKDVYNLTNTSVIPLNVRINGMKIVRQVNEGSAVVVFETFDDYIEAFNNLRIRQWETMVREDDYIKFVKQYSTVVTRPKGNEKIYIQEDAGCTRLYGVDEVLLVSIYCANGMYTQKCIDVDDLTFGEKRNVRKIRNDWLQTLGPDYDYCIEQTSNIDAILRHIRDIHNTYSGQLQLFKYAVEDNKKLGFDMCAYSVSYYDTKEKTKLWASEPEHFYQGLLEDYKDKVSNIETIGYGNIDMVYGVAYDIHFDNGTFLSIIYKDMEQLSKILNPYIKRGFKFRIVEAG